jgi:pilus assembly protein Flp/PilA
MLKLYTKIQSRIATLPRDDDEGAALVEYGLLVSLIALACVAALLALGGKLSGLFDEISSKL